MAGLWNRAERKSRAAQLYSSFLPARGEVASRLHAALPRAQAAVGERRREPSLCLAPRPPWASVATLSAHATVGMHSDIAAPSRTAIATVPPPPLGHADALRRRCSHAQAHPSIAPPPCCCRPTPLLPPYAMSTLKSRPRGRPRQVLTLLVSILNLDVTT